MADDDVHDHDVGFFDDDAVLVEHLARFVADGLAADETVVLVITASHRAALELDAGDHGRVICLDAADTLGRFMGATGPDPDRFAEVVGGAVASTVGRGRPVRAFGEMVGLLWDEGEAASAVELEALWNDLARTYEFSLRCAYRLSPTAGDHLEDIGRVCEQHDAVIGPLSTTAEPPAWSVEGDSLEVSRLFVPLPDSIRAARRFAAATLEAWGRPDLVDPTVLVASELATNALRHARSPFRLSLGRSADGVALTVEDRSEVRPVRRRPPEDVLGGRGIALVDGVSDRWGVGTHGSGKVVWSVVS